MLRISIFQKFISSSFLLVFLACGSPENKIKLLIPEERLLPLLVEAQILEGVLSKYRYSDTDSVAQQLYTDLFAKHNTTEAEYDSALLYLSWHPDYMAALIEKAKTELELRQKAGLLLKAVPVAK